MPKDEPSLRAWLIDRWVEKDKLIDEYAKTGKFEDYGKIKPTFFKHDVKRIVLANLFFLTAVLVTIAPILLIYYYIDWRYMLKVVEDHLFT